MMLPAVLFGVLQLCSLQLMAASSPVHSLQGVLATCAHHCLRDLRGTFPVHCVQYNANISFPVSLFPAGRTNHAQCRQVLWVIYESLEGAWNVFEDFNITLGEDGLHWDEDKFDTFLNFLYQLREEGSNMSGFMTSDLLSSYFDNVRAVLQQQGSATCGWEALKRDLQYVLKLALQNYYHCFTWRDGRSTVTSSMC